MIKLSCTREGKNKRKKREKNVIAVARSCRFHVTSKKAWRGIRCSSVLKGYSSGQSHFSEINVKLAEKNKYATHSVQRSLEMCENKEKPSISEDFRQKKFYQ